MFSIGILGWISHGGSLMALLANNWLLGVLIVASLIFCETGFVIFPFLPGDSLLFATGAFLGSHGISPFLAIVITGLAAVLGDGANYLIGRSAWGQKLIQRNWIKPKHIDKVRDYFYRFGAPTVTIGRFIPIVRTLAPFLAGLSGMPPWRFALYNVLGAIFWCASTLLAGYWLGGNPWVRIHMSGLSLGFLLVMLLLALHHWKRREVTIGG